VRVRIPGDSAARPDPTQLRRASPPTPPTRPGSTRPPHVPWARERSSATRAQGAGASPPDRRARGSAGRCRGALVEYGPRAAAQPPRPATAAPPRRAARPGTTAPAAGPSPQEPGGSAAALFDRDGSPRPPTDLRACRPFAARPAATEWADSPRPARIVASGGGHTIGSGRGSGSTARSRPDGDAFFIGSALRSPRPPSIPGRFARAPLAPNRRFAAIADRAAPCKTRMDLSSPDDSSGLRPRWRRHTYTRWSAPGAITTSAMSGALDLTQPGNFA
jgi:hypothetical protein